MMIFQGCVKNVKASWKAILVKCAHFRNTYFEIRQRMTRYSIKEHMWKSYAGL
jgi:hypothetical protein